MEIQTAAKGVAELALEIVFFADRHGGKYAEGLSQNGKTAEGDEKGGQGQPQRKLIR